ncbi:MAG: hypothetical protein BMS9Abin05_0095 [Rhodothermia bacterium]|nr:MAG: hypothetical protein BMS9Abin05_0095 [Rhodothermia bacterium]
MPTYKYRREDGTTFEIEQRITAPALKTCPTTHQPVTRLISRGAGLVFKGSGFYLTDYARAGSNNPEKETAEKASGESKKKGDASKSTESSSKASGSSSESETSGSKSND